MIVETLADAGAEHIRFNPLTSRVCIKELKRIAAEEKLAVNDATLAAIVESSHCDLFNAIQALRIHLLGAAVRATGLGKGAKGSGGRKGGKGDKSNVAEGRQVRDMGLDLFHALGKILHNKRFNAAGERVHFTARYASAMRCT